MPDTHFIRKFTKKHTQRIPTQKLVVFPVESKKYAVSIERVQRILNQFTPQAIDRSGRSLMEYNDRTITLIDLSSLSLKLEVAECQFLIICTLPQGKLFGLPIPDLPKILEVSDDKFGEIPELYQDSQLPEAVEKLIHTPDGTLVFYLNLEKLCYRQATFE